MNITQRTNGQIEDWVINNLINGCLEDGLINYAQYWHKRLYGKYFDRVSMYNKPNFII